MRDAQEFMFVALGVISILIHRLMSVSGTALDLAAQNNNMCRPQQARSDDALPATRVIRCINACRPRHRIRHVCTVSAYRCRQLRTASYDLGSLSINCRPNGNEGVVEDPRKQVQTS